MAQRASGWYDDPDDPSQLRYFDGILWTERRTPKVMPGLEGSTIGSPSLQQKSDQEASAKVRRDRDHGGATPAAPPAEPVSPQDPPPSTWQPPSDNPWQAPPSNNPWQAPPTAGQTPERGQQQYPPGYGVPTKIRPRTPDGQLISGWWRRLVAYFIDSVIVLGVSFAVSWPWSQSWFETYRAYVSDVMDASRNGSSAPPMPDSLSDIPWQWALISVLLYAVYEIALVTWRGRTVGKVVTGISVRSWEHARPPSLSEAAVRFLVKGIATVVYPVPVLSGLGSIFTVVDGLWPLGDGRKQALHDKAPSTVVVIGKVHRQQPLK
ncbi:RDD family protein [Luteipulveratus mongoliensis]|uniref:RDD domain-containing protein n=1 Tax=Luteipulveratus mongoliensis TaxID=571913 RepID=A0A0K1JHX6_9MICO|nr:RDD family protein [Luteipulveratus mongoliensis]AKU16317.1 hypothetical protein VV02_11345 [Luteipulveratus mongoliensis]